MNVELLVRETLFNYSRRSNIYATATITNVAMLLSRPMLASCSPDAPVFLRRLRL